MGLVYPPNEVFFTPRRSLSENLGGYSTSNWIRTVCPPGGGMFSYYVDHPFPRKGHTYPEACEANNVVKKLTVGIFMTLARPEMILSALAFIIVPWKFKIRFLEHGLKQYLRMAEYSERTHFLQKKFYTLTGQELWNFVTHFLQNLGISADTSYRIGRLAAHLLEHDDAYLLRVKDIFTEVNKFAMLESPRKEIMRVVRIYVSREQVNVEERFVSVAKVLSYALILPRINKAFKTAFREVKIEKLRLDDADKYYSRQRSDYDFMGEDIKTRENKFISAYNRYAIQRFKKEVEDSVKSPENKRKLIEQLNAFGV